VAQEPYLKKIVVEEPKPEEPKPFKMEEPNTDEPIVFDLDSFEFEDDDEVIAPDNNRKEPYMQPSLFNFNKQEEEEEEEEETRKPYSFDFIKAEIKKEIEEEEERQRKGFDFEFDIEGDYEEETFTNKHEVEEDEDDMIDELMEGAAIPTSKKVQLMEERKRREEQLAGQKYEMKSDDFKERLDVPAYERKKVALKDVPHSSERHVSRFNLTDDNQILGNNKFLHDNVD
jgi:cell division protein FtsZ